MIQKNKNGMVGNKEIIQILLQMMETLTDRIMEIKRYIAKWIKIKNDKCYEDRQPNKLDQDIGYLNDMSAVLF